MMRAGWELSAPLANRMVHLEWSLPGDVVATGLAQGFRDVEVPTLDSEKVGDHDKQARILVGGFFHHRRDMVVQAPGERAEATRAFPTPRTWENAARLLASAQASAASDGVVRVLLTGTVGQAATIKFLQWQRALDLPDPEQILCDPAGPVLAMRHAPYLSSALLRMLIVETDDCPTAATDQRWRLRQPRLRGRAHRGAAGLHLAARGEPLPARPPHPVERPQPTRRAGPYLLLLQQARETQERGGRGDDSREVCGSGATGDTRPWERPGRVGADGSVDPGDADLVRDAIAADIDRHARTGGQVPAGLRRWAGDRLQPVVDWHAELRAVATKHIGQHAGRRDYTYRRPSRRRAPGW